MNYDVFLSHNSQDKPAVEQIGIKLQEEYGLKCWLDKWNLVPGEPWQEALEDALDDCQTVAVFVGPNTISPWENEEMRSALEERVRDKTRRVIPVLLPGAPDNRDLKLPRFLTRLTWVDLRTPTAADSSLYLLYCGIKGIAPEQGMGNQAAGGALPLGSHIPFLRNALFTGREHELEKIAEFLLGKNPSATLISQAIIGMGGIGKTQLAVELAYRYSSQFRGVHWLDLRDTAALDSQIALCGEKMEFSYWPKEQPEQVSLTIRTWQKDGPRLLVLDNFENIQAAVEVFTRLQHPNLRLLITSRHSDWPASLGLQSLPLNVFTTDDSIVFLRKYTTERFSSDELKELGDRLGDLPLALELAGRYLEQHPRLSIKQYLSNIQQALEHPSMRGFRKDLPNATGHDLDLLATFALSWQEVNNNEIAQSIFVASGYCAPNAIIPSELFEETFSIDEITCDENVSILSGLGLLKENITIHPLLADYARYLDHSKKIISELSQALGDIVKKRIVEVERSGSLSIFSPLFPHLRLIAEKAEAANIQSSAYLWNSLGNYIQILADYSGARAAIEKAVKIYEAALGPDHPDVASAVGDLGSALQHLGDLQGAKAAFERALKIHEAALGPDHPDVATDVNNLGRLLRDLGDLQGAKAALERALKIDEAALGPDHPDVARDVGNLGGVLQDLTDLQGAKAALERALKIDEAALGLDHPDVAVDVNNLGRLLRDLGDLQGAKAAFERASKIADAALGLDHPYVATYVANLGGVLQDLGDLQGAKAALERALKIDEAALGPDHWDVASDVNNLGLVLRDLGDLQGAKASFERALKIHEATLGPDHPSVAGDLNNLGAVFRDLGDLRAAKINLERALPIFQKTYGETFKTCELLNNLGLITIELGNTSGMKYLLRARFIAQKVVPRSHSLRKQIEQNIQMANIMIRNPSTFRRPRRK